MILLVFILSGVIAVLAGLGAYSLLGSYFSAKTLFIVSVMVAMLSAYLAGRLILGRVNQKMRLSCPICDGEETLQENHTLQCQLPEYQCQHCHRVYRGGDIASS